MPAKEPMYWVIPIVAGLVSGGGGSAGVNYLWGPDSKPVKDPVLEYRISQCELRGEKLMEDISDLKTKIASLPPPDWRTKIENIERDVKEISHSLIRFEQHTHPKE